MRRMLLLLTVAAMMATIVVVSFATSADAKAKDCPPGYTADFVGATNPGPGPGCYGPDVTGQKDPTCPPPGYPVQVGSAVERDVCFTPFVKKHGNK
jgi:hypothetical protein